MTFLPGSSLPPALRQQSSRGRMMTRAALTCLTLALPMALHAQEAQDTPAIYAPCLAERPAAAGYVAAMQDAGWTHLAEGNSEREAARLAPAEIRAGMTLFQSSFESFTETMNFVNRVALSSASDFQIADLFSRDDVSAALWMMTEADGTIQVSCVFAGRSVPEVEAVLGPDPTRIDGIAFIHNVQDTPPGPNTIALRLEAMRYEGTPFVLAPLNGREGILVSHRFGPAQ